MWSPRLPRDERLRHHGVDQITFSIEATTRAGEARVDRLTPQG